MPDYSDLTKFLKKFVPEPKKSVGRDDAKERGITVLPGEKLSHVHGTRSSYMMGCRCQECRTGNAVYQQAQREKMRQKTKERHGRDDQATS